MSTVLILFIAASVVSLIIRESRDGESTDSGSLSVESANDSQIPEDRLIVYYFHGNIRCQTCNTLEAYSDEAVTTLFAEELESGLIDWQVVNYDETWNEHFLTDYDLSFQSLVLADIRDGKEVDHENLEEIWDLVGDKSAYFEYVKGAIDSSLATR